MDCAASWTERSAQYSSRNVRTRDVQLRLHCAPPRQASFPYELSLQPAFVNMIVVGMNMDFLMWGTIGIVDYSWNNREISMVESGRARLARHFVAEIAHSENKDFRQTALLWNGEFRERLGFLRTGEQGIDLHAAGISVGAVRAVHAIRAVAVMASAGAVAVVFAFAIIAIVVLAVHVVVLTMTFATVLAGTAFADGFFMVGSVVFSGGMCRWHCRFLSLIWNIVFRFNIQNEGRLWIFAGKKILLRYTKICATTTSHGRIRAWLRKERLRVEPCVRVCAGRETRVGLLRISAC